MWFSGGPKDNPVSKQHIVRPCRTLCPDVVEATCLLLHLSHGHNHKYIRWPGELAEALARRQNLLKICANMESPRTFSLQDFNQSIYEPLDVAVNANKFVYLLVDYPDYLRSHCQGSRCSATRRDSRMAEAFANLTNNGVAWPLAQQYIPEFRVGVPQVSYTLDVAWTSVTI